MSEIDHDWEQLPIAELHQFDALCDRFERAIAADPNARVETFIAELSQPQQRLLVRELVSLEIEHRHTTRASPDPEEFALRFPQWADELRTLATQCLEELEQARIESSETLEENSGSGHTIETSKADLHRRWSEQWLACSAAARPFGLPADGALGHYLLQSVIGRGGMGLVVRARDTRLDRDVAIKVLATNLPGDNATHERFLREARAAAAIRHTNVVTVYAVEIISDIPFLVMELVDGVTLDKYLQQSGKLSPGEIVSLAAQIAEGLASAHRQGLIHRDIKPANILLERSTKDVSGVQALSPWHVRIADFGLARIAADRKLTNSGLIAGTPQYMSPEQANGKEIDSRSDLFSLGTIMYAMCTGEDAFQGESPLAILRKVAEQLPRSLSEICPHVPVWLIDVIDTLMEKSPDKRIQSADKVAVLLDARRQEMQYLTPAGNSISPAVQQTGKSPPCRPIVRWLAWSMPLVFAAVLFILSRRGGTIRFEINDPGITVRFAGEEVQINDGDNAYRFVAGDHELSVTHGDLSFITKDFKLSRGEDVRLQVTFLDQQLLVERDGKPLWVGQEVAQNEAVADVLPSQLSSYSWPKNLPSPAIVPFTAAEAKTHQEAWAERLGVAVETENSIGMKLRLIPPGEFLMGSSETELAQETRIAREKHMLEWVFAFLPFEPPQHHVTLTKPFGIGIYEVTRGQFRQFVDATGYITESEKSGKGGTGFKSRAIVDGLEFSWKTDLGYEPPQTDESPVVNVSWNDAAEFCKWLSEKEGETYRLPSEAEWEYACRGGNPGRFCFGDDSALIHKYGWIGDGLRQGARRVGEGAGNSFGLFDMHGNVWEFCQDFHGPYPDMAVTDPTGPVSGDLRVGRGGTWGTYAELSRSAYRSSGNHGAFSAGFRVAKDLNVPRDSSSK